MADNFSNPLPKICSPFSPRLHRRSTKLRSPSSLTSGNWKELDNRFFRTLAFGTGGLRGKTISAVVTRAERGTPQALGRPEFPCVGTNAMNYYNISRATQGLVAYVKEYFRQERTQRKALDLHLPRHALLLARICGTRRQGDD